MSKKTVVIISLIAVAGFAGLLIYGLRHARGIPTVIDPPKRVRLPIPTLEHTLDLADGVDVEFWDARPAVKVDLIHQMTIKPWPKKRVPSVDVRAFKNEKDIYFCLSWPDESPDRAVQPATFSDACAIMFPLGTNAEPVSIIMGFLGKSSIWHWKADRDALFWGDASAAAPTPAYSDYYYPFEDEETLSTSRDQQVLPVKELLAIRVGTLSPKPHQRVKGRGMWTNGLWRVVIKRPMAPVDADSEIDALFGPDGVRAAAFAVWNGSAGDRGGRKSISGFVRLEWSE